MALKTASTKPEVVEQNALVALQALSPMALFSVEPPKQQDDLLPQFKIPYAIEMGDTFKGEHIYRAVLFDGKTVVKVPTPYLLTVIAARPATRKLIALPDGKKEYERGFAPLGQNGKSAAVYQAHMADAQAERGNSYVLAVICGTSVSICELSAFKLMKDYWGNPLFQARSQNMLALSVTTDDHSANLTSSKTDATKKYLDPKKFKGHQIVDLTPEQLNLVATALQGAKAKFDAWVSR